MRVLEGLAAEEVSRFARWAALDLLVMGTIGRAGIPGLLIGNTAEETLHRVGCSILALKPPGFVSPVA